MSLIDGRDGNFRLFAGYAKMYSIEAVTAGHVAGLVADNTTYGVGNAVQETDTDDTAPIDGHLACGVFTETLAAAGWTQVQVAGIATGVACESGVVAGDSLIPGAASGSAHRLYALFATGSVSQAEGQLFSRRPVFGYALTDVSSSTCTVFLTDPFGLARIP